MKKIFIRDRELNPLHLRHCNRWNLLYKKNSDRRNPRHRVNISRATNTQKDCKFLLSKKIPYTLESYFPTTELGEIAMVKKGFGKSPQNLLNKSKRKLETYQMPHLGSDRIVRTVHLKAHSKNKALAKFQVFVGTLELCLTGANDCEIQDFMEKNQP